MNTKQIFVILGAIAVLWMGLVARSWTEADRAPASVSSVGTETNPNNFTAPHPKFAD